MSSDHVELCLGGVDLENSNYLLNNVNLSLSGNNQPNLTLLPTMPLFEKREDIIGDYVNNVSAHGYDFNKKPSSSFPDVSRVIGCINRVLKLSNYSPANSSQTGKFFHNDLIAVIPAYNEELTIGMVVLLSLQHVGKVIVVDDGSFDRTREVAELAGAEVIHLNNNLGKVRAIQIGIKKVIQTEFKSIIMIDANGLYNPHEIPYLTTLVLEEEADIVIGSRFLRNPNIISTYNFTGKFPGFMSFGKNAAKLLCQTDSCTLNNNISYFFSTNGLKVAEVPISVRKKKISQNSIKKTIIALPAYNEESNLESVIKGALQFSNTILVVDDGSTDNTALVAGEAGAIVVKHEKNLGYGGALNTIFSTARTMEADALIIMDSDGQHNPKDIQQLLEKLDQGVDVVIGSRFLEIKNNIPLYRQFGMKTLDLFTKAAGVQKITDSQSGFRAYGKEAIKILKITGIGMSAGSEILIQVSDNKLKIQEVPITVRYDIEDTSTHNPIFHGFSVLSNIFALINFRNPRVIFGLPAGVLIFLGLLVLLSMNIFRELEDIPHLYLYSLSITLLMMGFVIGCEGQIYHYYINKSKN